jgi:hypothetical protein
VTSQRAELVCEHCARRFVPKRKRNATTKNRFCSVTCRTAFTRRKSRLCLGCGGQFIPTHVKNKTCSRSCGASLVARSRPGRERLARAQRARAKAYARRLADRLAGMSKADIWRLAYQRGFQACWLRHVKGVPVPKRPAYQVVDDQRVPA